MNGSGVDPDGLEHGDDERREDAATEGDQHVVDEQLPRESDEVHAALDPAPAAAGIRDAHDQPERDRQVQGRQRLGGAVRRERIDVGEHGRRDERKGQPTDGPGVQPSSPHEIAGHERQDEEAQVAGVEPGVVVQLQSEERRHLDRHGRRRRETERDDGIRSCRRLRLPGVGGGHHELLPEAIGVLARELPREGVEVTHALHRYEKCLIGGEASVDQHRDLLAQMVLQLRDVDGLDGLPAEEVAPPLVDLFLERYLVTWSRDRQAPCGNRRRPAGTGRASARQMSRSVASTACHCRCTSAS